VVVVPKQLVCKTYNLLVDSAVLSRVLASGTAELLLNGVETLVGVIFATALVLLGVGAGVHLGMRCVVWLWEYDLGE
jgi:hypothetical protein